MSSTDQERWQKVKERLRAELGEDIFTSWFARMELEAVDKGAVRLSVPTRFLRNWIQAHYSERVLSNWQAEDSIITRLELNVRSAAIRPLPVKSKPAQLPPPVRELNAGSHNGVEVRASVPFMTVHEALGGSPLDRASPSRRSSSAAPTPSPTPRPGRSRPAGAANRSCSTRSTSTPASGSARPTCCKRSPGPATAATARCSI